MALASFREFEDYQYLQSYQDFGTYNLLDNHDVDYYLNNCLPTEPVTSIGDTDSFNFAGDEAFNLNQLEDFSPSVDLDNGVEQMTFHQGFELFNHPQEELPPKPSSLQSSSDVILSALSLADARKCDDCNYSFTDENGPEVFVECGHMVCKSCYVWSYELSQGRCAQCYKIVGLMKPSREQQQSQIHGMETNLMSIGMPTSTPAIPSSRSHENVVLSFPEPVQFIMDKEEPITPGSPDKGMFRYSITADTLSVKLDSNASISTALDFLKDIHIKEAANTPSTPVTSSSSELAIMSAPTHQPSPTHAQVLNSQPQPQKKKVKRYPKPDSTNGDFPTILIGTQGQIKRAVKRQAQMDNNTHGHHSLPNSTQTSPNGYPQYGGGYIQNLQILPQQTKRRVVLLPNFSKLNTLNIRPPHNASKNTST